MRIIYERDNFKLMGAYKTPQIYKSADENYVKYQLSDVLFNTFRRKQKKSSRKSKNVDDDDKEGIHRKIKEFLNECKLRNHFPTPYDNDAIEQLNIENIGLMNKFYDLSSTFEYREVRGENNNLSYGIVTLIADHEFLIPPNCRFFNRKIEDIKSYLDGSREKFDFIVIDPPWKSRYIKRLKKTCKKQSYFMMCDDEISNIPIENYIHSSSIVIIWCTNSQMHEEAITNRFLARWNLKLISIWNWVKVDKCGNTYCDFDGSKKPYEKIFIASHCNSNKSAIDDVVVKDLFLICQPSSIHSHKPFLLGKHQIK
jgi:N6-adenosine-specific RNA methylase IME4